MSNIISTKDGRLHIYVRQDKYKGKLKSENWVGRTFHKGKQKVVSSGTTDLEEAKKILEQWYDDLISGKLDVNENSEKDLNNDINLEQDVETSNINDDQVSNIKQEITKENQLQNNTSSKIPEEKKKKLFNFDLSSLKNLSSLKDKLSFKKDNLENKNDKKNKKYF